MTTIDGLKVLFVAGFGPVVKDPAASKSFFVDTLGLPLAAREDNPTYLHGDKIDGVRYFALWPLAQAAESCFGKSPWPTDVPAPHAWLELDVEDVTTATKALEKRGYKLLVADRKEPWGQVVTRLLSPEGMLVGLTFTPWMRKKGG